MTSWQKQQLRIMVSDKLMNLQMEKIDGAIRWIPEDRRPSSYKLYRELYFAINDIPTTED